MRGVGRGRAAGVAAGLLAGVSLVTACGADPIVRPSAAGEAAVSAPADDVPPPSPPTASVPTTSTVADDQRAGLPVPSVYRIEIEGTVHNDHGSLPVEVVGWLLVTYPYDETAAGLNDVNIVDIGIRTDLSPLIGYAGAIWFGTNTSIARDLGITTTVQGADVDVVTERRDDDVVYADVIHGLTPNADFNVYDVRDDQSAAQISYLLEGTVSVRFAADGSSITGRIDLGGTSGMGDPRVTTQYHADISGQRYVVD